jgi:sec-independent protein translocase protein TatB
MQMFGVGPLEMMVILIIAVIVVGPERLPQVAADLARWINRARAYANHLTRDFNEVVQELEKEVGASRDDWKEIGNVFSGATSEIKAEVEKATGELKQSLDLEAVKRAELAPAVSEPSAVTSEPATDTNGNGTAPIEAPAGETDNSTAAEPAAEGEQPWYATGRASRRRSREQ